jgi:hypothetical protein
MQYRGDRPPHAQAESASGPDDGSAAIALVRQYDGLTDRAYTATPAMLVWLASPLGAASVKGHPASSLGDRLQPDEPIRDMLNRGSRLLTPAA